MSFYTPLLEYGYTNLAVIHPRIVNSMWEQSNSWLERLGPRNAVEGLPHRWVRFHLKTVHFAPWQIVFPVLPGC